LRWRGSDWRAVMRAKAVVVLALGLATVGCGSDTIDAAEVEAGIERTIDESSVSGSGA
jgi:hypothetical protein